MEDRGDSDEEIDQLDACFGSTQLLDVPVFGLSEGFQLQLPSQPSMTKILREVKRKEHSIQNMVASVVYDAQVFVGRVGRHYEGWPVLGNKRCGAWYVSPDMFPSAKTCYFKSTDGHVNKWSFSFARLNLHVALDAVRHGGCVIVDATRRGKMFPDALSKTVPIWCAVVNTAVALYRTDAGTGDGDGFATDLKLPSWVPEAEAFQIESKIDTWAMQLLDAGIEEFETLAREMTAPMECVWAHPSHASLPEVADLRQDRTVIVLVSASIYGSRERRALVLGNGEEFVFDYVAGAGDDEESWAMGLTPALMWANRDEIVRGGEIFVKELVASSATGQVELDQDPANETGGSGTGVAHGVLASGVDCSSGEQEATVCTQISDTGISIASHAYAKRHIDALRDLGTSIVSVLSRDLEDLVGCQPSSMVSSASRSRLTAGSVKSKDCRIVELDTAGNAKVTRYCWVADATSRKHPVIEYSPYVIAFVSYHLGRGHRVIFIYDDRTSSIAASLLIAAIIALFTIEDTKLQSASGYNVDGKTASIMPAVRRDSFSRETFRKYVAKVTVQIPHIVTRKSILKEVFNVFVR